MTDFNQFAEQYDRLLDESLSLSGESSEYFTRYKAAFLARLAGTAHPKTILDFGCGVGNLSRALHEHFPGARIDGFDVSTGSLGQVPQALLRQGTFTCSTAELGCHYELIVLSNVLHHVPVPERPALLESLAQRLHAGGRVAVFEHNPLNPVTRLVVSRCPFDEDAILLRPREVCRLLRGAGLQGLRVDYIVFFPRPLAVLRPLEPALKWLPMGAQFCAVGVR